MLKYLNFIEGHFVDEVGSATIDVLNPSDELVIARIPETKISVVDAAVDAARRAQPAWAKLPAIQRANRLRRIAAKICEH